MLFSLFLHGLQTHFLSFPFTLSPFSSFFLLFHSWQCYDLVLSPPSLSTLPPLPRSSIFSFAFLFAFPPSSSSFFPPSGDSVIAYCLSLSIYSLIPIFFISLFLYSHIDGGITFFFFLLFNFNIFLSLFIYLLSFSLPNSFVLYLFYTFYSETVFSFYSFFGSSLGPK